MRGACQEWDRLTNSTTWGKVDTFDSVRSPSAVVVSRRWLLRGKATRLPRLGLPTSTSTVLSQSSWTRYHWEISQTATCTHYLQQVRQNGQHHQTKKQASTHTRRYFVPKKLHEIVNWIFTNGGTPDSVSVVQQNADSAQARLQQCSPRSQAC